MPNAEFRAAIRQGLAAELRRDPSVVVMGEDVGYAGGVFQVTRGLFDEFGAERIIDTPISELALAGAAFGGAVAGLRPVVEVMFGDFMTLAMDSLVNQAAKYWFISNEQHSVPLVVRTAVGAANGFGALHSQIPASWFQSVSGLKIVSPATPQDAHDLIRAAIRDENPVLFLEHKSLYASKGELNPDAPPTSIGSARKLRSGGDVTVVATMSGTVDALVAAERADGAGIHVEVIDLRTLRPLDIPTVLDSVVRTKRLLVVEEGPRGGGWGAEVMASVSEAGIAGWAGRRLTFPSTPLPFSPVLEATYLPGPDRIVSGIADLIGAQIAVEASA